MIEDLKKEVTTSVVCIKATTKGRSVGVASFNHTSKRFTLHQFDDNEHYTSLEAALLQIQPSSCACVSLDDPIEFKKVCDTIHSSGGATPLTAPCVLKKKLFETTTMEQDMCRLLFVPTDGEEQNDARRALQVRALLRRLDSVPLAGSCMCACITYLKLLSDESNFSQCTAVVLPLEGYMRLDGAAHVALSVLPTKGENSREPTTLFGLLNSCRTKIGSVRLMRWLREPIMDINILKNRQDSVECLVREECLRITLLSDCLRKICDLDSITNKLHRVSSVSDTNNKNINNNIYNNIINLEDLVKLYDSIIIGRKIIDIINNARQQCDSKSHELMGGFSHVFLDALVAATSAAQNFAKLVEHVVDLEDAGKNSYHVRVTLSIDLMTAGDRVESARSLVSQERQRVEHQLSTHTHTHTHNK
eukprot:GHVR01092537.1.p1 GENE.GHVR01092537.1~~GHVR01092537.1.p1  ORF type:complete len:435 (+),score=132.21 GHVR01092537.1:49-1305(+)